MNLFHKRLNLKQWANMTSHKIDIMAELWPSRNERKNQMNTLPNLCHTN